jgi:aspartyl/asparaginyl beta-hydroxylase (cupin superfamily)
LFAIEESQIQVHKTVYYESFIATLKTGWMQFEQESVPVAVVRCNNETKIITKSSISDVATGQISSSDSSLFSSDKESFSHY